MYYHFVCLLLFVSFLRLVLRVTCVDLPTSTVVNVFARFICFSIMTDTWVHASSESDEHLSWCLHHIIHSSSDMCMNIKQWLSWNILNLWVVFFWRVTCVIPMSDVKTSVVIEGWRAEVLATELQNNKQAELHGVSYRYICCFISFWLFLY